MKILIRYQNLRETANKAAIACILSPPNLRSSNIT